MNVVGTATFVCLGGLASQAIAQSALEGEWCTGTETLFIDTFGIGFNDNTICDVSNLPIAMDQNDSWSSDVACRSVRIVDADNDGTDEVIKIPIDGLTMIRFVGAADGTLVVKTDFHAEDLHFLPCDAFN